MSDAPINPYRLSGDEPERPFHQEPNPHTEPEHAEMSRAFFYEYFPAMLDTFAFTLRITPGITLAYCAQTVILIAQQFAADIRQGLTAAAWEMADHVRAAAEAGHKVAEPDVPEAGQDCPCPIDHNLEANGLVVFLENAERGDNASAVKVLEALWRELDPDETTIHVHVAAAFLSHVVGAIVFTVFGSPVDEQH